MRQGGKQGCCHDRNKIREEICRLGRSLFERGLTPGSSGNISVKLDDGGWLVTPTNASLGSLDPARLSRLGADGRLVSGDAPTKEVPLHTALYQTRGAARAVVHLHSTHSVALSMLPEIDPRAALPPMTPYYLMKCGATALVPYYRPGDPAVRRCDQGAGRKIFIRAARQSRPGGIGRYAGSRGVRDRGTGRDRKTLSAAARAEPALSVAGAGGGFVKDVRADAAGAWARHTPRHCERSEAIHGRNPRCGLLRRKRSRRRKQ
jgi:hypothetical protein